MGDTIDKALGSVIRGLTEEKYAQSLAAYLFWLDIGQTYYQIPSDQVLNVIWNNRATTDSINPHNGQLIHSTAHLILRFARDAESGHIAVPHSSGLQSRLCARTLRGFFSNNAETMMSARELSDSWVGDAVGGFHADVNLVAHWANLGYIEEASIRDHILQSLIYQPPLWTHHADALIILFKLAGATFGKYTDPSVLDRCFELLKAHHYYHDLEKVTLVQEVIALRERGWEGLPPPPVFTTRESKPVGTNQKDPAATPVATFLGLPSTDIEPEVTQSPPHESITVLEEDTIPAAPVTPVTHSPSISIATLSDFTIADASDDESFIDPAIRATSDDETPVDPADATPHEIFYLEDGNVEVLCGSTLFRVNISTLSFHSPVLRRMFAKSSLATAESPNGCPRILSSDTAKDFTTLLKVIYLPGFPERNRVPDFPTFSSLLRITAKYEMPIVRSQLLEVICDAYPETFEGLAPSKALGECVFSGLTPHPNEVLNLFVEQKLMSALPMAYYMAARRGPNSLVDGRLPRNAALPPKVLQSAITGLMRLREVELNETHRLIFGPKGSHPCSTPNCPSHTPAAPPTSEAYQKVFDHIVGSSRLGTNLLQVPEFHEACGGDDQRASPGICRSCTERWESGHAELRKKVWAMLPDVFGLKG